MMAGGFFRFIFLLLAATSAWSITPRCTSGTLISLLDLRVAPPEGGKLLPLREVNVIPEGAVLQYTPGHFPAENPARARLAVIFVPADRDHAVEVTGPARADRPAVWTAPFRVSVAGVVFGPQGLDRKRVSRLVRADSDLMEQLAEYADKSTQAENLFHALVAYDRQAGSGQNLEAALTGFAGAWRVPVSRIDPNAPLDQQAALLLRTLNPALATIDPLAPQGTARFQQTAVLAASVGGLLWGNTVGLAAGSTALFLNLRTMLFPNTDFRSSFAQASAEQLVLCAPRETHKPRTRLAYLWAVKVPDLSPPQLTLARTGHLGAGLRGEVPVKSAAMEGRFLLRAHDWRLASTKGDGVFPVQVFPASPSGRLSAIQVDLGGNQVPPGEYQLQGRWDWTDLKVEGTMQVHSIGPLSAARPTPESQDRLITGSGLVTLELAGADFQFVEKASLRKEGDPPSRTASLELLPSGEAAPGPRPMVRIGVDTTNLSAGRYTLLLAQPGGQVSEIPIRILPVPPVLEGLPLRVNLGETEQPITLRGQGLDRLEALEADAASLKLGEGGPPERRALVRLSEGARRGDRLALRLKVEGVHSELVVPDALVVAGPRPRIARISISPAPETSVEVRHAEMAAGAPRTLSVRTGRLESPPRARVRCENDAHTLAAVSLRTGEEQRGTRMQQTGPDTLFLSLEPGRIGSPGCELLLTIETDGEGPSDPARLGTIVRLPQIEKFEFTEERTPDGLYVAELEGYELDTIARAGWNREEGYAVLDLPAPLPGQPRRQLLRIALPWPAPSPRAPLHIFLHKETTGRLTKTHL